MIVASRVLKIINDDQSMTAVVNIFMPEMHEADWICRYEIHWPDRKRSSFVAGIDSVQALHLVLQKIGIDIYMSDYHMLGHLIWTEAGEGYGFPVPKNGREFLIGQDKEFDG